MFFCCTPVRFSGFKIFYGLPAVESRYFPSPTAVLRVTIGVTTREITVFKNMSINIFDVTNLFYPHSDYSAFL